MSRNLARAVGFLLLVVLIGEALLSATEYWYPFDDGTIGHIAERAANGEIPHVDFDDPYTGALTFLIGGLFRVFGFDLAVTRYLFVVVALAGSIALYHLLGRNTSFLQRVFVSAAVFVTWTSAYRTPLPTWFTTVLTLFAMALVLGSDRSGQRRALWAGVIVFVAALFKVTALYALGAFWIYYTARFVTRFRYLVLAVPSLVGVALLSGRPTPETAVYFAVPLLLAVVVAASIGPEDDASRVAAKAEALSFLSGFGGAFGMFVAILAPLGWLSPFWNGVIVTPMVRIVSVEREAPPIDLVLAAVLVFLAFGIADRLMRGRAAKRSTLLFAVIAGALSAVAPFTAFVYAVLLAGFASTAVFVFSVVRTPAPLALSHESALIFAMPAFAMLVGFPFFTGLYILYVLPFVILLFERFMRSSAFKGVPIAVALVFAVTTSILEMQDRLIGGVPVEPPVATVPSTMARASLQIDSTYEYYNAIVPEVRQRVEQGALWAGPDLAALYFLADTPNPTRTVYEIFTEDPYPERWVEDLVDSGVCVVVLNRGVERVSSLPPDAQLAQLVKAFPVLQRFGPLEMRVRDDPACG